MVRTFTSIVAALLLAAAGAAGAAELGVLAPVKQGDTALVRPAPDGGSDAPVVTRVRSGALFDALQEEAASGFTGEMLELDELAAAAAGQRGATSWLLLSDEEGGFARRGFWLSEPAGMRWVDEPFVDLVVNAASIADGSFEEIFAHELGHVFLRRLLPRLPDGYSRTDHHSHTMTDQPTAFDEGFAIHFQAMARLLTRNARLRAFDAGIGLSPWGPLWQHNLDRNARIDGVRQNWFVHAQLAAPGDADPVLRRDMSLLFDRTRLKNPAQILATEGAVATFFYRHVVPLGEGDLAGRYTPLFQALHALDKEPLAPDTALLPALAATFLRVAPADGKRFVQVLVESSLGALASAEATRASEAAARFGRAGDMRNYLAAVKEARAATANALQATLAEPALLARSAGKPVWLLARPNLAVDLNIAEPEHLLALHGVDAGLAQRALDRRASGGPYSDLGDFIVRVGVPPAIAARLEAMQQAMRQAGTFRRK